MRKISFNTGEKVAVIDENKITYGEIVKIFPEVVPPVFVVAFDDGGISKVEIDRIAKVPEDKNVNQEEKIREDREPIEKAEITITPKQFLNITSKITAKECAKMGLAGVYVSTDIAKVLSKIHTALFMGEAEE